MTIAGTAVAERNGHDMTQPLAGKPTTAIAIRPGQEVFDDRQVAALSVLGVKEATKADLAVYFHVCRQTGLDPFLKQIYLINRRVKDGDQWVVKQTIQVGIDGFRVIRDRVAQRLGVTVEYEDTIWYDADGGAHDVWLWEHAPVACKVTVIKDGRRYPGVVRTAAYAATNRQGEMVSQWRTQPDHMIEKCAEAFALRRAFPNDLGGVYLPEESADGEAVQPQPAAPARLRGADIAGRRPASAPAQAEPVPASEPAPDPSPEPAPGAPEPSSLPGSSTREQYAELWSLFAERFGFTREDKAQARQACERLIGRQLIGGTMGNLSADEAAALIAALGNLAGRDELVALLASKTAEETP
jgi:phage recombination protein Bet